MSLGDHESRLRPMVASDLALVRGWRNHPHIRQYMYTRHEISGDEHLAWFDRASADPRRHLLIFEKRARPTGFISIEFSDAPGRRANWGFYLSPDAPRGSGQALGQAAVSYAFNTMDVHKLCGEALALNSRSIAFHLRLGFFKEGVLRDHHFDGDQYHDVHVFGLLNRDREQTSHREAIGRIELTSKNSQEE